jgi:16S rRNA (adenine1518-N6/adenine1519-N6)-dimethyltransferase
VLVRLDRHPLPAGDAGAVSYDRLFAVVRGGFAHRRKMLRRSLDGLVQPEAFVATGIRPTARAEELGLEEWGRLAAWTPEEPPTEEPPTEEPPTEEPPTDTQEDR